MEYLDYIISVKTVDSVDEAIEHINTYNTGHSESIITKDYNNANRFLDEIDALCPSRETVNATSARLCSLLLALFDEISERVVVIGATNRY